MKYTEITLKLTEACEDEKCFEIYADGTKVGTIEIETGFEDDFTDVSSYSYVERIDIDEEFRGNGIGTEVLTHALYNECGWECRNVICAPDNEDAQRLYERIGSEVSGDICRAFGDYDQGYGVYVI